jgi:hypothetical protein
MANVVAYTFFTLVAVQVIGTLVFLVMIGGLFSTLRLSHTSTWDSLGKPSLLFNNTVRNNMLVLRWLWKRGYVNLEDPIATRRASTARTLLLLLLLNFFVLISLFLIPQFTAALVSRHAA